MRLEKTIDEIQHLSTAEILTQQTHTISTRKEQRGGDVQETDGYRTIYERFPPPNVAQVIVMQGKLLKHNLRVRDTITMVKTKQQIEQRIFGTQSINTEFKP